MSACIFQNQSITKNVKFKEKRHQLALEYLRDYLVVKINLKER